MIDNNAEAASFLLNALVFLEKGTDEDFIRILGPVHGPRVFYGVRAQGLKYITQSPEAFRALLRLSAHLLSEPADAHS